VGNQRLQSFKGYVEESYLAEMVEVGAVEEAWPIAKTAGRALAKGAGKLIKGTAKGLYKGSAWAAKKAIATVKQKRSEFNKKELRKRAAEKIAATRQKAGQVASAPAKALKKRKDSESYDQYAKERAAKLGKTPEKQDHVEKTKQRMKLPDNIKYQHKVKTPTGPGMPKPGRGGIDSPSRKRFYNR
jgi:hypothetical protein